MYRRYVVESICPQSGPKRCGSVQSGTNRRRLQMTIGTALVLIAILYLIDKHKLWKRAVQCCLVAGLVGLVGLAAYFGWHLWEERKTAMELRESDAVQAILYPIKVDDNEKTKAWEWYRASDCVVLDSATAPANRILHDTDLYDFGAYDNRWMNGIQLPQEVKHALWSAKVAECHLPSGSSRVRACLDRGTGTVDTDPWTKYMTDCGPKKEMIYLSAEKEAK